MHNPHINTFIDGKVQAVCLIIPLLSLCHQPTLARHILYPWAAPN